MSPHPVNKFFDEMLERYPNTKVYRMRHVGDYYIGVDYPHDMELHKEFYNRIKMYCEHAYYLGTHIKNHMGLVNNPPYDDTNTLVQMLLMNDWGGAPLLSTVSSIKNSPIQWYWIYCTSKLRCYGSPWCDHSYNYHSYNYPKYCYPCFLMKTRT